jgi:ATP-dependent helicase Lhr and Lhr-like helicase
MSLPFAGPTAAWFERRFGAATPAQATAWPAIARGEDVLIAAPTGSGKTLAAFLACLDRLFERASRGALEEGTQVVYVSPLKALSHDIQVNLERPLTELAAAWGAGPVTCAVRTGDTPTKDRARYIKKPAHVLVTTPESLYLLLTTQRGQAALQSVRTVIVDEIHAVCDDRRGAHLALSLERLDALVGGERRPQRIGLSATQHPITLVGQFLTGGRPCTIVDEGHRRRLDLDILAPDGELSAVLSHEQWGNVYDQLAGLAREHKTTIVFTNTRRLAERVAAALTTRLGEGKVAAHHGALSREVRQDAEERLRAGALSVMCATASLELGIDVGAVDLVCQLGSPRALATFLQRVGRAGHTPTAISPKGRVFALTRDDLIECAALVRAIRQGRLDALEVPLAPLDVLAQQLVAACAWGEWDVDELYARMRQAWPYRDLARTEFEAVLDMLAEGVATQRGRAAAHLHRDRVGNKVKGRRGARLAAVLSGGTIPDRADYDVILDPEGTRVGTLDEDFAIESTAGDIFQLGNTSWKIRRVELGKVRVEDAHGQPPTVPFWNGEAPARTAELSQEVGGIREGVAARLDDGTAADWLFAEAGLSGPLAAQLVDYARATRAALGVVPTQTQLVCERFFDDGGGMQLVIHAPFGGRINRAWGQALRKRFCRNFDFELQAAATDDGILLSLGSQHSFPLESIADYVAPHLARELLTQAALQAPVFETRWRWNVTRALAVLRHQGGKKVPPPILRIRVADLLAAVFPAQAGCQDNNPTGEIEPPDHPLVNQTLRDCLEEAMDLAGLIAVLERLGSGEIQWITRESPEPSPMSHAIISANPWAFLDDAPLEERRTRAVSLRRTLPVEMQDAVGALDAAAIAQVIADAAPVPRDPDELHDHLCVAGLVRPRPEWRAFFESLAAARRAALTDRGFWVAAERLHVARAVHGELAVDPAIVAPPGSPTPDRDEAVRAVVRGVLELCGPISEAELATALLLDPGDAAIACAQLEGEGTAIRGRFRGTGEVDWCHRGLLARIHRLTIGRLRREIEPVTQADLRRFLHSWQHASPGHQLHGTAGLAVVLTQLEGFEAPVAAWESEILPARIADYRPELLDELCLGGDFVWGRRSLPRSEAPPTTRATPIAFWRRSSGWLAGPGATPAPGSPADLVRRALTERGALFQAELATHTRLSPADLETGLWGLVAAGLATADGFGALRALGEHDVRARRRAGRWSLLRADAAPADAAEQLARTLLARWGVVLREVCTREDLPPWRDLLLAWRRMEIRGEIRGGRFVQGFVGEQFALPEAVDALRAVRRQPGSPPSPAPPRDPLHVRVLLPVTAIPPATYAEA